MYQYIGTGAGGQRALRLGPVACILRRADPVFGLAFVLVAHWGRDTPVLASPSLEVHSPPCALDLLQVHAWVGSAKMPYTLERGSVSVAVVVMRCDDRLAVWMAQVGLGEVKDDP